MEHLSKTICRRFIAMLLCVLLYAQTSAASTERPPAARPAATSNASSPSNFNLDFGFGKEIAITAVVAGAVVGVGLYFLLRKGPGITGCPVPGAAGLQIEDESDHRTYALSGKTALLQPEHRVRVYGKKKKSKSSPTSGTFIVKNHSKDMGACMVAASH